MALTLARIFADGMVLQRDKALELWGTAVPGEVVRVAIQGQEATSAADYAGQWRCELAPLHSSEQETLDVVSGTERLSLTRVAVGEVFVAAGQSNMEYWMRYDRELEEARASCANERIRFYDAPKCSYPGQLEDFDYSEAGVWRTASPEELDRFSAVAYYCARVLEERLDVPIGIVGCNYGGTISSAWMRADHARALEPEQAAAFDAQLGDLSYAELLAQGRLNPKNDKGYATWPAWNEFFLPRTPNEAEIAEFMRAEAAKASGPADVGGLDVGASADGASAGVRPELLTPTKEAPGALYTHMVLPIAGFAARGVLWYQGESDDEIPAARPRYATALRAIIADWRAAWHDPELAFLVVQLPGFGSWMGLPAGDYGAIRACQQEVADDTEGVWLCSIGDMGDDHDIHPKVKRPVGERLALLALCHLYGHGLLADAPRVTEAQRVGARVTIRFCHAGDGLTIEGAEVDDLRLHCGDRALPFAAHAEGDCLVLDLQREPSSELSVSYGQSNAHCLNLYNSAHIPALPFVMCC